MRALFLLLVFFVSTCCASETKVLIFGGKTGWIGSKLSQMMRKDHHVFHARSRLENRADVAREIDIIQPDYIINCAGVTGVPNVDWCETHPQETLRVNILGTLNLLDLSAERDIHLTNIGTGCIYQYDEKHPMHSGIGYTEKDRPNFSGSLYAKTKVYIEDLLPYYPNVLQMRIRMPISHDLHPKSFVTKIIRYKKVINIPNSMSVLDDILPLIIDMTTRKLKGTYNMVNPGTISHNEILDLYKELVDPTFTYENFSVEEQNKILAVPRSNCELNAEKLLGLYPGIPDVKDSVRDVFTRMKQSP